MDLDDILWNLAKLGRLRFWYLVSRKGKRCFFYLFMGLNNAISIFFLGVVALYTSWPLIFPSLGPSLFLIFYAPENPMSSPRNTLLGHLLGGTIGLLSFKLAEMMGLISGQGLDLVKIAILSVALGVCGVSMIITRLLHPPAASTCLIGALGLIPHWYFLPLLTVSIGIIILQALLMHRLAGVEYPLWRHHFSTSGPYMRLKNGTFHFAGDKGELLKMAEKLTSYTKKGCSSLKDNKL